MKTIFFAFMFLAISLNANAELIADRDYDYPISNPLLATVITHVNFLKFSHYTHESIITVKRRERFENFEKYNGVPFAYSLSSKKAPVIFIVPGLGGEANNRMGMALGHLFHKKGYHVVLVTNPFNWKFTLGASASGVPGFFPRDSKDLYEMMKRIDSHLRRNKNMRASSYAITGYSLGGGILPFVMKEDREQKYFNFRKVVSINPPVDFKGGIDTVDRFGATKLSWQDVKKRDVLRELLHVAYTLLTFRKDQQKYYTSMNKVDVSDKMLKWMIGKVFKRALASAIYASHEVRNHGALRARPEKFPYDDRFKEAMKFNYTQYGNKFVIPDLKDSNFRGRADFYFASDMRSLADFIRNDPSAYLIHNADDFLMHKESQLPWIQQNYQDRWMVYPSGGHCGNYWHPYFQKRLLKIFDTEVGAPMPKQPIPKPIGLPEDNNRHVDKASPIPHEASVPN